MEVGGSIPGVSEKKKKRDGWCNGNGKYGRDEIVVVAVEVIDMRMVVYGLSIKN